MTFPDPTRTPRCRVLDDMGRSRTLDSSAASWVRLTPEPSVCGPTTHNMPVLLLGLGPAPQAAPPYALPHPATPPRQIVYLEAPAMAAQLPAPAARGVPEDWRGLTPEQLMPFLEACQKARTGAEIWLYAQESRLFSAFWGPVLGQVRAHLGGLTGLSRRGAEAPCRQTVLLPGEAHSLLTHELEAAFAARGYTPVRLPENPAACLAAVTARLRDERPALFLSVNLRGLDAEGTLAHLLAACGVPVAVWFVDNPWHCLSSLRLPWWQGLPLFVTDASFVEPLRRHGAASVHHLPLAAWYSPDSLPQAGPGPAAAGSEALNPVVFVGRSAFPQRDAFFAACRTPAVLLAEATARVHTTTPPHVHWWGEQLGVNAWWPGSACREAGFGAEQCALLRRRVWLAEAARHGLTVFGDAGWRTPPLSEQPIDLRPPLDYYGSLARVYAAAHVSLNVTSLLLPAGLTQRHFDVWAAGGFLLTDATPGLALFPPELTRDIALPVATDLGPALRRLANDPALRGHLQTAWQKEIASRHTYAHRVDAIIEQLQKDLVTPPNGQTLAKCPLPCA